MPVKPPKILKEFNRRNIYFSQSLFINDQVIIGSHVSAPYFYKQSWSKVKR